MATSTITTVTDDVDGSPNAEPFHFGLDGTEYVIDLGPANRARLREALEPYINAGRRVSRNGQRIKLRPAREPRHDPAVIREWAAAHTSHKLADRGRIPAAVVMEYEQWLAGTWTPPAKAKSRKRPAIEPAIEP